MPGLEASPAFYTGGQCKQPRSQHTRGPGYSVCQDRPTAGPRTEERARELAQMLECELGTISVSALLLRLLKRHTPHKPCVPALAGLATNSP